MLPNGVCFHIPLKATMTSGGRATDLSSVRKVRIKALLAGALTSRGQVRERLKAGAFAHVAEEAKKDAEILQEFAQVLLPALSNTHARYPCCLQYIGRP